jgi:hypothetical protein
MIVQRPAFLFSTVSMFLLAWGSISAHAAATWPLPEIRLPAPLKHPVIACTPEELARLRAACQGRGPELRVVSERVAATERALAKPVVFPPRGGQHNQWYQCEKCQLALHTLDETHHQ